MHGWYDADFSWGWWIAMALIMVLFWAGLIAVVILVVRRLNPNRGTSQTSSPHDEAERILNERFARGEIDADELAARRAALRQS